MPWVKNACSCLEPRPAKLFESIDHNFGNIPGLGDFQRCAQCGSMFPALFPAGETLNEAYSSYYTSKPGGAGRSFSGWILEIGRGAYLNRDTPKSARSVLDYGCGSGAFLVRLHQQGFNGSLWGTDLFEPPPAEGAYKWLSLDDFSKQDRQYAWITLNHVFEHAADLPLVIKQLSAAVDRQGAVWISTPSAQSFLFDALGPWARDVDYPRHKEIFAAEGLSKLMALYGFDTTFVAPPRLNAILNLISSLKNVLRDPALRPRGKLKLAAAGLLSLTGHLFQWGPAYMRKAPELIAICRPRASS